MKRRDLYIFRRGLIESDFSHATITFIVNKNKRLVNQEISDMEKITEPNNEYKKYQLEKEQIAKKYANKKEDGSYDMIKIPDIMTGDIKMVYNVDGIFDENSKYNKEVKALNKKFEKAIKEHEEKINKYNEFLNEESEFKPYTIGLKLLADNEKCPSRIMDKIHWMISDT